MSALRRRSGDGDGEADRVSVAALALGDEVQVGACVRGWGGLTCKRACAQLSQTQATMIPQAMSPGERVAIKNRGFGLVERAHTLHGVACTHARAHSGGGARPSKPFCVPCPP